MSVAFCGISVIDALEMARCSLYAPPKYGHQMPGLNQKESAVKFCNRWGRCISIVFGLAAFIPCMAQDASISTWEKGSLQFGGFVATFDSELTFGISGGGNASINGESLLGLDSSLAVFRAEAMYRPGESRRNQLDFAYGGYHRDGDATLSRDVTIDGVTYPVGAEVESVFNFDLIRGTYSYAFLQNEHVRLAVGLGIYVLPLRYELEIESNDGRSAVDGADTTLPLPALGFRAEVRLVSKLFLKAAVDGLYVEFDDFSGSLIDLNVGLEYRPWKHFGLGVGYNFLDANVEGESNNSDYPGVDFVGTVDVQFSGVLLYGKVSF